MNDIFKLDLKRYQGKKRGMTIKFLCYLRKAQASHNKLVVIYYKYRMSMLRKYNHLEISPDTFIGPGFYIGHGYNITINPKAVLGKNINIHKGVTTGQENRGVRKGTPVIGDMVWIGTNTVIVGNIKIGNDVLIAPNSYVNCDVPDHSVVFGNPCVIKPKPNATENYINNCV